MKEEKTLVKLGVQIDSISESGGYFFDIINNHSITLQNNITDNYLENGTAVQDCITFSPIVVTLQGLCGELIYKPATAWQNNITNVTQNAFSKLPLDKLGTLEVLLPQLSNAAELARQAVQQVETTYKRYEKVVKSFKNEQPFLKQTRLKEVYQNFLNLRNQAVSLTVETPYDTLNNMYIQSVTLRQNDQKYISDIELTLKQVNFATIKYKEADKNVMAKYNEIARAEVENNGKAQGVNVSLAKQLKLFG